MGRYTVCVHAFILVGLGFYDNHQYFLFLKPQKVYMNINRILSVASRLMESGHYAAQHIGNVASKLDQVRLCLKSTGVTVLMVYMD